MTMQMIASCTHIMLYKWQRTKFVCNEKDLPRCVAPMLWNEQALSGIRKSESRSYLRNLKYKLWNFRKDRLFRNLKPFTEYYPYKTKQV